jgi:hypothetical protein
MPDLVGGEEKRELEAAVTEVKAGGFKGCALERGEGRAEETELELALEWDGGGEVQATFFRDEEGLGCCWCLVSDM